MDGGVMRGGFIRRDGKSIGTDWKSIEMAFCDIDSRNEGESDRAMSSGIDHFGGILINNS